MYVLAAAAILAASPQNAPAQRPVVTGQAIATIRIISGAVLRLGEAVRSGYAPAAQDSVVHTDGGIQPARLIEFE
jgi:hypothetical protein